MYKKNKTLMKLKEIALWKLEWENTEGPKIKLN